MSDIFRDPHADFYTSPQDRREVTESKRVLTLLRNYEVVKQPNDVFFSADYEIDFNMWRIMAEKKVVAEHLLDEFYQFDTIHSWPATPWQMFKENHKEKWWMRWLHKRRPTQWEQTTEWGQIRVKRYLGYPDAAIPSDSLGRPVPIEMFERRR